MEPAFSQSRQSFDPFRQPFQALESAIKSTHSEVASTAFREETYVSVFSFESNEKPNKVDLLLTKIWHKHNGKDLRELSAELRMECRDPNLEGRIEKLIRDSTTTMLGKFPVQTTIKFVDKYPPQEAAEIDLAPPSQFNPKVLSEESVQHFFSPKQQNNQSNSKTVMQFLGNDQTININLERKWTGPKTCGTGIEGSAIIHMEKEDPELCKQISKIIQSVTWFSMSGTFPIVSSKNIKFDYPASMKTGEQKI
ncbi:MAG: hypothetical protein H0X29_06330 [Parachlamydiaceae bacterium]|nr:hypothetical protein [Parachlamydiaceae bacterium]